MAANFFTCRFTPVAAATMLAAFLTCAPTQADAQTVAVMVGGEPITSLDIEQRTKLTTLTTHKTPARQEVVQELIDEK